MTDVTHDHQARIEALARRRAARTAPATPAPTGPPPRQPKPRRSDRPAHQQRPPVAAGSKIATAGFGVAAMLALVGAMAAASGSPGATALVAAAPVSVDPAPVVVRIHPVAGSGAVPLTTPAPSPTQRVALTARPAVRQAPASAAPVTRTHGSR